MLLSVEGRVGKMSRNFMPEMISGRYKGESIARDCLVAHFVKGRIWLVPH